MIVGAAIVPTAPLLVEGVSDTVVDGVGRVRAATRAALSGLPAADCAVLVTAGAPAVHDAGVASLAGVGRPDLRAAVATCEGLRAKVAAALGYDVQHGGDLPLGLAVMALLWPSAPPLLPLTVPADQEFDDLAAAGAVLAEVADSADRRTVVVAAGDLSAGLDESSPLWRIPGALFWDEQAAAVVDSGRMGGLARLGPAEAHRVGAAGWAPMAVLHGAVARAKVGTVVRHYSAPRGVGYLVASG